MIRLGCTAGVSRHAMLIDYLRKQERQGVTHVPLDAEARVILRSYYRSGNAGRAPAAAALPRTAPALTPPSPAPSPAPTATLTLSGETKEAKLSSLRQQAEHWAPAQALGTLRETMVFSSGSPDAPIVFVGEAPGYEDERLRAPLQGKAGEKFDAILAAMGLQREQVYLTNICKFRPSLSGQTTNNRKASHEEKQAFLPFIRAEIGIIQPQCIVALDATAAEALLDSSLAVNLLRGEWHEFEDIPLRVTYHPSYLLHNADAQAEKRKVWEDMLSVMARLNMPISDKQQGYFSKR